MKFRVFLNHSVAGPYEVSELVNLPGFDLNTSVCYDGDDYWKPAKEVPPITRYIGLPAKPAPEPVSQLAPLKLNNKDWRMTIISGDYPDVVYSRNSKYATRSARALPAKQTREPVGFLRKTFVHLEAGRKSILMLVCLLTISLDEPVANIAAKTYQSLSIAGKPSIVELMGIRFKQGRAHSARGLSRRATRQKRLSNDFVVETSEIGSVDLGHGLREKTVVITRIRNGVKTYETRTLTVPSRR